LSINKTTSSPLALRVLAYLDPAQREQLQDEDTWIARQLFVLWALPGHADFSPYAIIPQLLRATKGEKTDVRGYVSLLSAHNFHGMINQAPHVIQIVAERIRPTVRTPFGTYQFHRLDSALIGGYGP
jgi:hypothetical protein